MGIFTGTDGTDSVIGSDENDTLFGYAGNDFIDGRGGFDFAAYWTSPFAISVRLFANIVDNDGFGGVDILNDIEAIAGTAFGDVIYGNDFGNTIQGFFGNDTVFGLGGDEIIRVAEGDDYVDGGAGTDRLFFEGNRSDYTVTPITGGFLIVDGVADRYGTDTVLNVELFQFANTQLTAADLPNPSAPGDGLPYPPPSTPPPSTPPPTTPPGASGGFGGANLVFTGFGAGPGAGSWASDDRYPRHLADVNGDGRADIVGFGEAGALVSLANGSGGFGGTTLGIAAFGAGAGGGGWASDDRYPRHLADVNGDGRADIVGFGEAGVLVSLGNGNGGFGGTTLALAAFGAGPGAGGWASDDRYPRHLADVNGDGRADIVGFGEAGVLVSLGNGAGGFGGTTLALAAFGAGAGAGGWASDDRYPRHLADVNGDGRADIVGFGEAGVLVSLGNGAGGFGGTTLALAAFGAGAGAGGWASDDRYPRHLADVNGDGRADIVGFGEAGALVSLANGSGGFGGMTLAVGAFGAGASGGGWASDDRYPRELADVNGDGRADIIGFGEAGVLVAQSSNVWA